MRVRKAVGYAPCVPFGGLTIGYETSAPSVAAELVANVLQAEPALLQSDPRQIAVAADLPLRLRSDR